MTGNKNTAKSCFSGSFQTILSNVGLAGFYLVFVYLNARSLSVELKASIILLLFFNSYIAVLSLMRRTPKEASKSAFDYIVTFCGTLSPLLFQGVPERGDSTILLALQITGIMISFIGVLSLRTSFGLVPANRGIVTTGLYKYVRHPLYAGYLLSCLAFFLQNFSFRNVAVFVIFLVFESLRLLIEENFLSQNEEYAAYMKKTKWRVIPYIW